MRDKYLFEMNPDNSLSTEARMRQKDLEKLFAANKSSRKLLSSGAYDRMGQTLQNVRLVTDENARQAKVHDALHEYEKDFLYIGHWRRFRASLKLRYRSLRIDETSVPGDATLYEKFAIEEKLGTIHLDHMRFIPLDPQPLGDNPTIYRRMGDGASRHYIMLPQGTGHPPLFVRRFVVRGLNGHNAMELDARQPMRAAYVTKQVATIGKPQPQEMKNPSIGKPSPTRHDISQDALLTESQQILSHARGWKKRYISAGVGNYAPLSTRGDPFVSLFGNVVIDLAKLPIGNIFDIHSPRGAQTNLSYDPTLVVTQGAKYPANDYGDEQYLAMRDVLRTRELLIKREVPFAAVVCRALGRKILAVGFQESKKDDPDDAKRNAAILAIAAGRVDEENEAFTWSDQKRWYFALYGSVNECLQAKLAMEQHYLTNPKKPTLVLLNQFDFVKPPGMV